MKLRFPLRVTVMLLLITGTAAAQVPLSSAGSISSAVVTLDGALQLDTGIGGSVVNGTIPTASGGSEVPNAAQLSISMQASSIWSPGVLIYNNRAIRPGISEASPLPRTIGGDAFSRLPITTSRDSDSLYLSRKPIYLPAVRATVGAEAIDDMTGAADGEYTTGRAGALAGLSSPAAAAGLMGPPRMDGGASCLDSSTGCGDLLVPTLHVALLRKASLPPARNTLPKLAAPSFGSRKPAGATTQRSSRTQRQAEHTPRESGDGGP